MTNRNRKVILQNDNQSSRELARKMSNKGYIVLLKYEDWEEPKPFPF